MKKEGLFDPSSSPLRAKIVIFLEYAACGLYFSISCKLSPEKLTPTYGRNRCWAV